MELLPLLPLLLGLAAALALVNQALAFRRAVRACRLTAGRFASTASGTLSGLPVEVTREPRRGRVLVSVSGLPAGVRLSPEGPGLAVGKALFGGLIEDHKVGDPAFDAAFIVGGDRHRVFSVLDAESRRLALRAAALVDALTLEDGVLSGTLRARVVSRGALAEALEALLPLAAALRSGEHSQGLFQRAFEDPAAGVRYQCLRLVLETAGGELRERAIQQALIHRQPDLRYLAAWAAGDRAWPVMLELAGGHRYPSALRAAAMAQLPEGPPAEDLAEVVRGALGRPDPTLVAAAARLAARLPPGDGALEELLLGVLARRGDETRAAAVEGLAAAGTARSVAPLLALAEEVGAPRGLRQAARAAARAIQARLTGAEAGALSLSEVAGGALSLPGAIDPGAVSLQPQEER